MWNVQCAKWKSKAVWPNPHTQILYKFQSIGTRWTHVSLFSQHGLNTQRKDRVRAQYKNHSNENLHTYKNIPSQMGHISNPLNAYFRGFYCERLCWVFCVLHFSATHVATCFTTCLIARTELTNQLAESCVYFVGKTKKICVQNALDSKAQHSQHMQQQQQFRQTTCFCLRFSILCVWVGEWMCMCVANM